MQRRERAPARNVVESSHGGIRSLIMNVSQDREKMRTSPSSVFARPQDVLVANDLSKDEKRKILDQWKEDAIALQVAADENMASGEGTRLDEVVNALNALDKQ